MAYHTATGSCISIESGNPKLACNSLTRISMALTNVLIGVDDEALEGGTMRSEKGI